MSRTFNFVHRKNDMHLYLKKKNSQNPKIFFKILSYSHNYATNNTKKKNDRKK